VRIAVVQTQPAACEIGFNLNAHERWVKKAAGRGADMVFFPELSLLGYEPKHAARLALRADDARLSVFEMLSHALRITIGVGAPAEFCVATTLAMKLAHSPCSCAGASDFSAARAEVAEASPAVNNKQLESKRGDLQLICMECPSRPGNVRVRPR